MGTEGVWVPLVMAAVGAGANHMNQQQVAKRQDNILADQIRQNAARQEEADRAVSEAVRERAVSDAEQDRGGINDQYLSQVRAAQQAATQGLGQQGAVSGAYRESANDAALGIGEYGGKIANLMSRIDAPLQQRRREGVSDARLQNQLGMIGRNAGADDFLAQLRLRGVRPNPWLSAASSLASGAASGMASGAGAGAASGGGGGLQQFGSEAASWYGNPALWRTN